MDTIFMNSENSKTSEPHILKLKLKDKLDLRVIALSNLSIYYTWNNIKSSYNNNKNKNLKYQHQQNLHYLMDLIQHLIFRVILSKF